MSGLFRRGFAVGLCVLLGTLSPIAAFADTPSPDPTSTAASPKPSSQSTSYKLDKSAFSLLVSPTRLIIAAADIGSAHEFTLVNRGQAPLIVEAQKRDFVAGPNGSLDYQKDAPYGASPWVTLRPTHMTIEPGATQIVTLTVKMPDAPEPGDHQLAIVFLVPSGKTDGNIKINRGVATPVYITVPGKTVSSAALGDLRAPGFARRGPITVTATVHNTGNVHRDYRQPSPLTLRASGTAAAFPDFTVPRGADRDISTTWNPPFLCVCHVGVNFAGADNVVSTLTVQVIIFPWDLLAIIVGSLLLLLLIIKLARRRYRGQVTRAASLQAVSSGGV